MVIQVYIERSTKKTDAKKYAKDIETRMDKNMFEDYTGAAGTTLKMLLIKYKNEITVNKKGGRVR